MAVGYKGTHKHYGKSVGYFTFNNKVYCAWVRLGYSGNVETRPNTNPASHINQVQVMRQDTPTIEAEVMLPWGVTGASLTDFIAGKSGALVIGATANDDLFPNTARYGPYIIERSTIDISRDNFTTVRMTLRGLGYDQNRVNVTPGVPFTLWDPDFDSPATTQTQ